MFRTVEEFMAQVGDDAPTPAEWKLVESVRAGEVCTLGTAAPKRRTDARRVRAALLRLLINDATEDSGKTERGVGLIGGWVEGELDLSFVRARGWVMLRFCHFTAEPRFEQADLGALSLEGSHLPGLFAQGMKVEGSVRLLRAKVKGTVVLTGAKIGGQVACVGATLDGQGAMALNAQGVETGEGLFLNGVTATGTVDVAGAKIGGQFECVCMQLASTKFIKQQETNAISEESRLGFEDWESNALNAQGMRAEMLIWRKVRVKGGTVALPGAKVGVLVDDGHWPTGEDALNLHGFVYDRISGDTAPVSAEGRRVWLEAGSVWDGRFYPQPYTQLARVLREMGHAGEARTVACWREERLLDQRRREIEGAPRSKADVAHRGIWRGLWARLIGLWSFVLRIVAGYGFKPWRAAFCLAALWVIAAGLAGLVWREGSFAPNSDVILTSAGWEAALAADCFPPGDAAPDCIRNPAGDWSNDPARGMDWDSFSALGYGIDLVVPVLDLGQTSAWAPSKDRGLAGWWLWWGRWVLQGAGWLVLLIFVAAVTGIMQRERE